MARAMQTYAPESYYQKTEDFIKPTLGSGVEILVAWNERIIASHHFQQAGVFSIGSSEDNDVILPLPHPFLERSSRIRLGAVVEVDIPLGMKASLQKQSSQGDIEDHSISEGETKVILSQKEVLRIDFSENLKLLIRPSQPSPSPRFLPLFDLSSGGTVSFALAVSLSFLMAVFVQLSPSPKSRMEVDELYPVPLIIQNPSRVARFLVPPLKQQRKKSRFDSVKKAVEKVKPKRSSRTKVGKSRDSQPMARAPSPNLSNKRPRANGSKIKKGKGIKVAAQQGAQATSQSLKKSGIFTAFANSGEGGELQNHYKGSGALAGLAAHATNSAGESAARQGKMFGSRIKSTATGGGTGNVGVEELGGGSGHRSGLGTGSLGSKKGVSIIPSGQGALFSGSIDREGIRKIFFDNARAIRSCYERSLNRNARLTGKIVLDFNIGSGGQVMGVPSVKSSVSTIRNRKLTSCLLIQLKSWRFPDPPAGQVVNVLYPLAFSNR